MTQNLTADQLAELGTITTRNEAGKHFTEFADHWELLERLGLIEIDRPVHDQTGIAYSQDYWTLAVTDAGVELVDTEL